MLMHSKKMCIAFLRLLQYADANISCTVYNIDRISYQMQIHAIFNHLTANSVKQL